MTNEQQFRTDLENCRNALVAAENALALSTAADHADAACSIEDRIRQIREDVEERIGALGEVAA